MSDMPREEGSGMNSRETDGWVGATIGIILVVLFVVLFFIFALPALRHANTADGVQNPSGNTQINPGPDATSSGPDYQPGRTQ